MNGDLQALHRELLERFQAGDRIEALAAAQQFLDLAGTPEDPELRSLTAGVTATWLSLKSNLAPHEALPLCDEVFGRFAEAPGFESPATAAAALRMKVGLLLKAGRREDALKAGMRLARYVDTQKDAADQIQPAEQLIAAAGDFVGCDESELAIRLLRQASARLIKPDALRSRVPAAVAQLWLVVALMYSGAPRDIVSQATTFQEMGEPALEASDQLIRQWSKGAFWRRALMTAISLKIETLQWLERDDEAGRHQQLFVRVFDGSDLPGVQVVVDEYKTEASDS